MNTPENYVYNGMVNSCDPLQWLEILSSSGGGPEWVRLLEQLSCWLHQSFLGHCSRWKKREFSMTYSMETQRVEWDYIIMGITVLSKTLSHSLLMFDLEIHLYLLKWIGPFSWGLIKFIDKFTVRLFVLVDLLQGVSIDFRSISPISFCLSSLFWERSTFSKCKVDHSPHREQYLWCESSSEGNTDKSIVC